jgi:hypothetical protein
MMLICGCGFTCTETPALAVAEHPKVFVTVQPIE